MSNEEKILEMLERMQTDFGDMKAEIEGLERRFDGFETRFDGLEKRIDGLERRFDKLEKTVEELKESEEITRNGVNALLEWADDVSNTIRFPLPRIGVTRDA